MGKEVGQFPSCLGSALLCTRLHRWTCQSCSVRSSHALHDLVSDSWEGGANEQAGTRSRSTNKLKFYCVL